MCRIRRKDFSMKYLISVILVFVLIGIADAGVKQGDMEISVATAWQRLNFEPGIGGFSLDGAATALGLGYFLTNELEVGLSATGMWISIDDIGLDLGAYNVGANLKYHLLTEGTIVPYAGMQACYSFTEIMGPDFDGIMWGPLGGVKFFVSESTSIFVEYQYQLFGGNIGTVFEDGHEILVGLSFAF